MSFIKTVLDSVNDSNRAEIERFLMQGLEADPIVTGGCMPKGYPHPMSILMDFSALQAYYADEKHALARIRDMFPSVAKHPLFADYMKAVLDNQDYFVQVLAVNSNFAEIDSFSMPPYVGNPLKALKRHVQNHAGNLSAIDHLTGEITYVSSGSNGDVYKVQNKWAIKIYKPHRKFFVSDADTSNGVVHHVFSIKDRLDPQTCIIPVVGNKWDPAWYMYEFVPGVARMPFYEDLNDKLQVLEFYSRGLEKLHSNDLIRGDNNWRNVVFTPTNAKFIDIDCICATDNLSNRYEWNARYVPREGYIHYPCSFLSDLECFGIMIEDLLLSSPSRFARTNENDSQLYGQARANVRAYTPSAELPSQLHDVLTAVLKYPRNGDICIKDFTKAIASARTHLQ